MKAQQTQIGYKKFAEQPKIYLKIWSESSEMDIFFEIATAGSQILIFTHLITCIDA